MKRYAPELDFFHSGWMAFIPMILLWVGCSLPVSSGGGYMTMGSSRVEDEGRSVGTKVLGLDVRAGAGFDGVHLGWNAMQRRYALLENEVPEWNGDSESRWQYQWPLGLGREDGRGKRRYGWFFWRRPLEQEQKAQWVAVNQIGFGMGGGRYNGGMSLGWNRQSWVFVPTNQVGWWVLDTTRHHGKKECVFIQKDLKLNQSNP